jgi:NAD(P)-dependent dehydrogenase (short-subunit alcohol dehydrogenase family)
MPVDNVHPEPLEFEGNRLLGRRIIIVGASSGIGAAAVRRFSREGARVVAAARREELLAQVCKQVNDEGGDTSYVVCDVKDEAGVEAAVGTAVERMGGLDGAFNTAGVGGHGKLHTMETALFDEVVAVNLRGTFLAMKYEIRAMLDSGGGSIVNTSSIGGLVAAPDLLPYGAAKSAVNSLTRSAGVGYGPDNIRVNAIAPASTLTEMYERWLPTEEAKREIAALTPLNFIALPDDMARAALLLLSDETRWVNATILPVDGGAHAG